MRVFVALLPVLLACAVQAARADVYMGVSADGSIVLTNLQRSDRDYVRIRRESAVLPPPSAPVGSVSGRPYEQLIAAAAEANDLPPALLHAVISVESGYDPNARSPRGAAGLMQLMPATARELGVVDVWDPAANINGGARYLKRLLGLFDNDLSLALAAYNAGPGAVRSSGTIPGNAETRRYVPSVLEHYRRLSLARPASGF